MNNLYQSDLWRILGPILWVETSLGSLLVNLNKLPRASIENFKKFEKNLTKIWNVANFYKNFQ